MHYTDAIAFEFVFVTSRHCEVKMIHANAIPCKLRKYRIYLTFYKSNSILQYHNELRTCIMKLFDIWK